MFPFFAYADQNTAQSPTLPLHFDLIDAVTHPFSVSDLSRRVTPQTLQKLARTQLSSRDVVYFCYR